ncbi:MAG: Stp1/IreP family PP2C-type Ser/Thr phosphatase [Ilumatobacter sp.]|nr:Stp1/IreP family PP2C-type Ser/Thr phosphatase [Ilumatobacter sp.]
MTDEPVRPPVLAWGAATHPGRVRAENEDNFVAEPMIFGVADGMGGHQAGEVASEIAATTLRDRLHSGAASVDLMVAAVVEANAAIFQGAHTNPDQRGMGTTLTAVAAMPGPDGGPGRLVVANVGDSRTYVFRSGRLRRVTVDHSYVQELVSTGHITEAEARSHPRRNIVTRALGIEPTVKVDTWMHGLVRGDRYVLCSDGLVDEVEDSEIAAILTANAQPQDAADSLVAAANASGGRDNVTVVVIDVLDGEDPTTATAELVLDLDRDGDWGDQPHLIDAEAGADAAGTEVDAAGATPLPILAADAAPGPRPDRTLQLPAVDGASALGTTGPGLRRPPWGWLLFVISFGVIVTLTVVLFLVARHNESDPTPPTSTTSTTTSTTTTTATTSTTSTTVSTTLPSGTTSTPGSGA